MTPAHAAKALSATVILGCLLTAGAAIQEPFRTDTSVTQNRAAVGQKGPVEADGAGLNGLASAEKSVEFTVLGPAGCPSILLASDGLSGDNLGTSVAIDGTVAVAGATGVDSTGAAYVYRFDGASWVQEQKLLADDGQAGDAFGSAVGVEGNFIAVAAPKDDDSGADAGSVYIFEYNGATWNQTVKLVPTGFFQLKNFGQAVSLSGNVLAVGMPVHSPQEAFDPGRVFVFRYNGTSWSLEQQLIPTGSSGKARFGVALDLDAGTLLIVGASRDDVTGGASGSAYVYRHDGAMWVEEQRLLPSNGIQSAEFGKSVAISGNAALIGAKASTAPGSLAGVAYFFGFSSVSWTQEQEIIPPNGGSSQSFGSAVDLSGNVALITQLDPGAVKVYGFDGFVWSQTNTLLPVSGGAAFTGFGTSLSFGGAAALVGAPTSDLPCTGDPDCDFGAVHAYLDLPLMIDCNSNGVPDNCDITDSTSPDCNTNGIPDECDPDCNANSVPDDCDVRDLTSQDCNTNGTPDECEPDCNANGLPDVCEVRDQPSSDCNTNGIPDECDPDCNANSVPDDCDIRDLTSPDCNTNGIPDECDPDCNANGAPDDCDVRDGVSPDCNTNGIPDECDPDCNTNGTPDDCDVRDGISPDCNTNGVPDQCDRDCNADGTPDDCETDPLEQDCDFDNICNGVEIANCPAGDTSCQDDDGNGVPNNCEPIACSTSDQCLIGQFCNTLTGFCEFFFPCHPLPCPPGSVLENEPSCLLNAEDTFNGGCNTAVGAVFSPMTCNTTICGQTYRSGTRRDTDWYEIVLPESTRITLTLATDFEGAVLGFIQQIDGIHDWPTAEDACQNLVGYITPFDFHLDQACGTSLSVTECYPAGRIFAFVSNVGGQNAGVTFECHRYTLNVECPERPCSEACCFPDGGCQDLTGPECDRVGPGGRPTANSGNNLGAGTSCADDFLVCRIGCATATPIACNSTTQINNCDVYTQPGDPLHPECLEGSDVRPNPFYSCANGTMQTGTLWFSFVASSPSVGVTTCNSNPAGVGDPPGGGNSTFALYGGECNGGFNTTLTEIGCSEDDCGPANAPYQGFVCVGGLTPGDTYYIQFSAWAGLNRGAYDLDVLCPCPALAPGPCCLANGSCVIAPPDVCEDPSGLNGVYQGAEAPGFDCSDLAGAFGSGPNGVPDACERGACCDQDATCFFATENQCFGDLGGVSYTLGQSCTPQDQLTPNPCDGACCQYGLGITCFSRIEANCTLTVQTWYDDEGCSDFFFECPDPAVCNMFVNAGATEAPSGEPNLSNCQAPDITGVGLRVGGGATLLDANAGVFSTFSDTNEAMADFGIRNGRQATDDFQAKNAGDITKLCWWGQYNDTRTGGGQPVPNDCLVNDDFTIRYIADVDGCPAGAVIARFSQSEGTLTGVLRSYTGLRNPPADISEFSTSDRPPNQVWAYEANHAPVTVAAGEVVWIEIVNNTDDGSGTVHCAWGWETARFTEGNGRSFIHADAPDGTYDCSGIGADARRFDLAFCLDIDNNPPMPCAPVCTAGEVAGAADDLCTNGYIDATNSGCCNDSHLIGAACTALGPPDVNTPGRFQTISCGDTICGTTGWYDGPRKCPAGASDCTAPDTCLNGFCTGDPIRVRDQDWFAFALTESSFVEWCVTSKGPLFTGIFNNFGVNGCPQSMGPTVFFTNAGCDRQCGTDSFEPGIWFGFAASLLSNATVPCGTPYKISITCQANSCSLTAARSCAQHDCDRLCLDLLGGTNVENRIAGSTELEMDFATGTAPANPGVASIDCTDNSGAVTSHTASASASVSGDTVTVTFAPALPDQNACVITLNCGASVCIRMLQGDTNRDGTVTTGDFSAVRFWFNQTACAAGANIDFNAVNGITTGDASAVRFFFNNTTPACP